MYKRQGQSLGQLAVAQDLNAVQGLLDQTLCLQRLGVNDSCLLYTSRPSLLNGLLGVQLDDEVL